MQNKLINKYYLINKNILMLNNSYPFDLYKGIGDRVELILKNDENFIENELINDTSKIYVHSSQKAIYDKHLKKCKFIENKKKVFEDASKSIEEIFTNPELLSNHQDIKPTVNSLIEVVFEDEFTMSIVFELLNYDYYTHTHSLNVTVLSICLVKKLNLPKSELSDLALAALLHDIGKSKIDKNILNKEGALSVKEFEAMKKHTLYGYNYALKIGIKKESILSSIKSHHEKLDGSGYPDGLKGDEIHIFSKIISICDIFDALISQRVYKSPLSIYESFLLIKTQMKNKLDMKIVNTFILLLKNDN